MKRAVTPVEFAAVEALRGQGLGPQSSWNPYKGSHHEWYREWDPVRPFVYPYLPDYNPIEEAFSKLKSILRKAGVHHQEALIEALGAAISAITPADARGF